MIKNKFLIFIILVLVLLSISTASAEDSSVLNTEVSVCDESGIGNEAIDVVSYGQDNSQLQSGDVKNFTDLQNSNALNSETGNFTGITISKNNSAIGEYNHTIAANTGSKSAGIFGVAGDNAILKVGEISDVYVDYMKGSNTKNGSSWSNAVQTISQAMNIVADGGIIHLSDGIHFVNNQIAIDKMVTIVGNGTKTLITNKGNGNGVFEVTANNVAISNCAFVNNTNDGGGVIYNDGGSGFTVSNCTFTNNEATIHGGAIYNLGGDDFTVNNCSFISNMANGYGGAIYNLGGDDFTVINCSFIKNTAKYDVAISNRNKGSINLTNNMYSGIVWGKSYIYNVGTISSPVLVTVLGNQTVSIKPGDSVELFAAVTTADGGSVSGGKLNFIVNGNTLAATDVGNGTYTLTYTQSVEGKYLVNATCTGADNVTIQTGILNVRIVYDVYVDYNNGNDTREGSSWVDAVQTIGQAMGIVPNGGTIHLADGTHIVNSQITISKAIVIVGNGTKTLITNNKNGNGVFSVTANGVSIYNSTFINNSVIDYGAAICNYANDLTVSNCSFINNTAGQGVAIYNKGSINLTTNQYSGSEGKSYVYNVGIISSPVLVTVLGNQTVSIKPDEDVVLFAVVVTSDGASVSGGKLNFIVNANTLAASDVGNGTYTLTYTQSVEGKYLVNATYVNANHVATQTGALNVRVISDVYVDYNNGNNTKNGSSWSNAVQSIEYAVKTISPGGTIHLADGTHIVDAQIAISKAITIVGNGTKSLVTNNGNGNGVFGVTADNVVVRDCVFVNSSASSGGVIWNSGANFTVNNCNFINNSAGQGVAIYNKGSINLSGNRYSGIVGGKSYVYNAGIIISPIVVSVLGNQTVSIKPGDSVELFADVVTSDGAGVSGGKLNFTVNGNSLTASDLGNGTYVYSYTAPGVEGKYLVNVTYAGANNVTVETCVLNVRVIYDIYVDYVNGNDSKEGSGWGDAVQTISQAMSIVPKGGTIHLSDGIHIVNSQITINRTITIVGNGTKSLVTNNGNGNGVFGVTADNVVVRDCVFVNSSASSGGVVWNSGANFTVNNCSFINNTANQGLAIYNGGSINLTGNVYSGIVEGKSYVYNVGTIISPMVVTVLGNQTVSIKPGVSVELFADVVTSDGAGVSGGKLNFTVNGNSLTASDLGNGTYVYSYTAPGVEGKYLVNATYVNANYITTQTAILNVRVIYDIYVDYVNGNDSKEGSGWVDAVQTISQAMGIVPKGGTIHLSDGIHIVNSQITINRTIMIVGNGTKSLVTNNGNGNGVFGVTADNVAINNCTFVNNVANGNGGVIYNTGVAFGVSNCSFINNTARYGGVIYNDGGVDFIISKCSFINSTAVYGGVIYNNDGGVAFTVSNCSFISNKVRGYGGVIYNGGGVAFTVSNCSFINNTALYGAAIMNFCADFRVNNCSFISNMATSSGGVIRNSGANVTLGNSFFINNTALSSSYGGGVIYNFGTNLMVCNNIFTNNSANHGMVVYNGGTINLTNNSYSVITNGKTHIYDTNTILTPVVVTVLGNRTINVKSGENVVLFANITTEDGASVVGRPLSFSVDGSTVDSNVNGADNGNYTLSYTTSSNEGKYLVGASYSSAKIVTVETGVLNLVFDYYVDYVNGNDSDTGVNWGHAFKTISHAVSVASEGSTIYLADGIHIVDAQIAINKTVNIVGNGTKVLITNNGNGKGVFKVTVDEVSICNSTFINSTGEYGGVIENYGDNLSIINTIFNNNTADMGVTIYNEGTINLTNNKYSNTFIYNNGTIISPVIVNVLGNTTINTSYGASVVLSADITTEDGAGVIGQTLTFNINNTSCSATFDNKCNYTYTSYLVDFVGIKTLNATYNGAINLTVQTSTINSSRVTTKVNITLVNDIIDYGGNATIKVKVNTTTSDIVSGNVTIGVDGKEYGVVNLTEGIVSLSVFDLSAGKHIITVTYNGNDTYNTSTSNVTVNVNSVAPTITIDVTGMVYGESGTVTVTVNKCLNGAVPEGNVSISVGSIEKIVKLVDGVANLTVFGLTAGQNTVYVTYNGDRNYTGNSNSTFVNVSKASLEVDITVGNKIIYGENVAIDVNVTSGASGNVTVGVDGGVYGIVDLTNSIASLNISGLSAGEHNISVTYNGDDNYDASSTNKSINIAKATPTIIINSTELIYGEDGTITITVNKYLNGTAPTGNVTITIGSKKQNVTLKEGIATLSGSDLTAGQHTVDVTYSGDKNYTGNFNSSSINVGKASSKVDVMVNGVVYGENAVIDVNVTSGASGNVTVGVDGGVYGIVDLTNSIASLNIFGLSAGEHKITVTYNGDNNHNTSSNEVTVNVNQTAPTITIMSSELVYGGNGTIIITVDKYLNGAVPGGNVTISVDGESRDIDLVNGVASFSVSSLEAGKHNLMVIYSGDKNYTGNFNSSSINVGKASSKVDVMVNGVVYGENAVIDVNVTSGASGNVTVGVDGGVYGIVDLTNSIASLNIFGLSAGEHKITVTYNGDNNHNTSSNEVTVNVNQTTPLIIIGSSQLIYGGNGIITVTVNECLNGAVPTGNVTIVVGGIKHDVNLVGGVANLTVSGLTAGKHKINVTYDGDRNYTGNSNSTFVNVSKASLEVDITVGDKIIYGENVAIDVNVTSGASGNVTVGVDGKICDMVNLTNSIASLNISGLSAGEHNISVTYNGDDNYDVSSTNKSINIAKATPTIIINSIKLIYGGNGIITVTVNECLNGAVPTGNVTIVVGGIKHDVNLVGGVANWTVSGLTAGEHKINVTYSGDKNYTTNSSSSSINVGKAFSKVDVMVNSVVYGENATVKVNVTAGATGNVTIIIDNKKYDLIKLNNSEATLIIPNLTAGEHKINVTYSGDGNYKASNNTASVNIAKSNITMEIKVIGDVQTNIIISVMLPDDATGYVNITISDGTYSKTYQDINIVNGTANYTIPELYYGTYNITASYSGDSNYNSTKANSTLVLKIADYLMNITFNPTNPTLEEVVTVNVNLPKNATGKIIIAVDGKNYTVDVRDGVSNITISDVTVGKHTITVNYSGDNRYVGKNTTASFNISKAEANLVVKIDDIKVGEAINITATLIGVNNAKLNATVNVTINNKIYIINIINGTGSKIGDVFNKSGNVGYVVNWTGDNNYNAVLDEGSFNVSKVSDYNFNVTIPDEIKPNENTTITVEVPDDTKGNITVIIDGNRTIVVPIKNATTNISIPSLEPGDHNIIVNYTGDDKYDSTSMNKTVTVGSNVNLTADDVVMIYKDGSRLYATLLDAKAIPIANATLSFTINGITYNRITNRNGTASIALNLEYGTYIATISYENNTVNATVEIKSSIIAQGIVKMYQNGTQFSGTLLSKDGRALANTNVTFNINGVFYTRTTDINGTAKLNINLRPGNYTLTAYNPKTGEQRGFNVLVKSLIETNDLTKYYQNDSKFEAKIYNKDGSLAINKEVTFNINGVFYTRTSDANGTVKLAINLRPGDYIITSTYECLAIGNTVKVLPTLETSDISMKFRDGTTFKAKTLDNQGNCLPNQNITFNIHGVIYNRITDSNGIANLNINLIPGEYIITSYWNSFQTGNKIEII